MDEWSVPNGYRIGDRVSWRGVTLVCTHGHYAGDAAEHPWDPGAGWDALRASGLWTPSGADSTGALARSAEYEADERLHDVMLLATGPASA